jgi:hypothetical protein
MRPGATEIDLPDSCVSVRASNEDRVQRAAHLEVVEERPLPPDQLGVFDPLDPGAHVLRNGHGITPSYA